MASPLLPRGALLFDARELAALGLPQLERILASRAAVAALTTLPAAPGAIFSFGCFECRLDDAERVDFLACVLEEDAGRVASAALALTDSSIDPLLRAWALCEGAAADVSGIWMEWDLGPRGASPFSFVRIAERDHPAQWSSARLQRLLRWSLTHWVGSSDTEKDLVDRVVTIQERLPSDGMIFHLASQSARGVRKIRVHLGLPKRSLGEFLAALDWRGDKEWLQSRVDAWPNLPDPVGLQIDAGEGGLRRVDLEFYLDSAPSEDRRWQDARETFSRIRGVISEKFEAALAWADQRQVRLGEHAVLLRRTSLKLTLQSDGRESAKAYLGFSPRSLVVQ